MSTRALPLCVLAAAVIAFGTPTRAFGSACVWTGTTSSDWTAPTNWSSCGLLTPQAADTATVSVAGSFQPSIPAATSVTVAGLTINAGAIVTVNGTLSLGGLDGVGLVAVNGTLTWASGTMSGSGTTAVAAGGQLQISGADLKTISQRTISNAGTITWSGDGAISAQSSTLLNLPGGVFDIQNDAIFFGFAYTIANGGTLKKSVGSGTTTLSAIINNSGVVTAESGTLELQSDGFSTSSGSFQASAGHAIAFSGAGHVLTAASSVAATGSISFWSGGVAILGAYAVTGPAGSTSVLGGGVAFEGQASSSNATVDLGSLGGAGALTVSGAFHWLRGSLAGSGVLSILPGAALEIAGPGLKSIDGYTIENKGTATWTGTGPIQAAGGVRISNAVGAVFDVQNDSSIGANPATALTLENAGTFKKSLGAGTSQISGVFENSGQVQVQSGTLALFGPGDSSGTFSVSAGAILSFGNDSQVLEAASALTGSGNVSFVEGTDTRIAGAFDLTGTTRVAGGNVHFDGDAHAVNVVLSAGTLGGVGTLHVAGVFDWTGGAMTETGTTEIADVASLNIAQGDVALSQRRIRNRGTALWTGNPHIFSGRGAVFENVAGATFEIQNDRIFAFNQGEPPATIDNAGLLKKSAGSDTILVAFVHNSGTVRVESGTLHFGGIYTQTDGSTLLGGGDLSASFAPIAIQGGTLEGSGAILGNVFNGGTVSPGQSPGRLQINGNFAQTAQGTLAIELGGTNPGTEYDQLNVSGTMALAGTLAVASTFTPANGDVFTLASTDSAGPIAGVFRALPETGVLTAGGSTFRISYAGGDGNDVALKAGPAEAAAAALAVDASATASSDGNGVFEPGETSGVAPSWKNVGAGSFSLSGSTFEFLGPPGATYTTIQGSAEYGTLVPGQIASCGASCYAFFVSDPASRPAAHWDAVAKETPSTPDPPKAWTLHIGDSFTDVPRSQLFYKRIEALFHSGITSGCGPGVFCPGAAVNRSSMAIFLAKSIAGGGANVPTSGSVQGQDYVCVDLGFSLFTDVSPTDPACKHIHYLAAQNVTLGCGAALFCPAPNLTRAEMAIFVARAMVAPGGGAAVPESYGPDPVTGLSYSCSSGVPQLHFTDVSTSDSFCKHVHYLWARSVVSGCSATEYCPTQGVTRDAMAKFLGNAFNLVLYAP